MSKIKVFHSHIELSPYHLGDMESLEHDHYIWNRVYHRRDYYTMDIRDNTTLLLPRGIDINRLAYVTNSSVEYIDAPDPFDRYRNRYLIVEPRNDTQNSAINFLSGNDQRVRNIYSQYILTLPPGAGKTYCGIAASVVIGHKALVIVTRLKILNQWLASIVNMTTIPPGEVLNLTSSIMKKIYDGKMDVYPYKFFLTTHSSITQFANKNGWPAIGEIFKRLHIGIKIFDEAHRNFRNLVLVDMYTNTKRTFYLTATLKRSDFKEDIIFQKYFQSIPRWGENVLATMSRHIIYIAIEFNSSPDSYELAEMIGYNGYFDRNKYTNYVMRKGIVVDGIISFYERFIFHKYGRLMILSSTIESCQKIYEQLKKKFSTIEIGLYTSETSKQDKYDIEEKADIIIATTQSLGEGGDIKDLRYLIMVEAYVSGVSSFQIPHRLRPLGKDIFSFYIEFIDTGVKEVVKWQERRMKEFKRFFHSTRTVQLEEVYERGKNEYTNQD